MSLILIVSFGSKKLRTLCATSSELFKWLGVPHAQLFIQLISDVEAFDNAADLLEYLGNDVSLVLNRDALVVAIGTRYQGVFVATGAKFKRNDAGHVEWSSVRRLKLTELSECT